MDRDTIGMLTHQAENQLDGTILLGEFSTVRHDCSFLPPFFLALLAMGDTWPEALSGNHRRRADGSLELTVGFRTADYKAVNRIMPV
jgi:hypothetical protein